jgi:hypothetical protein
MHIHLRLGAFLSGVMLLTTPCAFSASEPATETVQKVESPRDWHLIPLPFYMPETSLGLSLTFAYLFRFERFPDARVSHNISTAAVTLREQFSVQNRGKVFLNG